ncbi:glycosyltransferase family 2 protein [Pseudooceanicola sp. C21-150M6]|uniref:glycosyltransferase family 2 protein n=1 Tax=Pseudooceanicola sp. C21-150M6 TaxID=3434355 RepID=UPI003D7F9B45
MSQIDPSKAPGAAAASHEMPVRAIRAASWDNTPWPVPPARRHDWSVVSTVRGDSRDIAQFVAWHLDLGARRVTLFLDDPEPGQAEVLARPEVTIHICDTAFWARRGKRPPAHQTRQIRNATEGWRQAETDWLLHIDMDEFLLPPAPVTDCLALVPEGCAVVHLPPVEQLSGAEGMFKRTARAAGQHKSVLEEVYPTFGAYLRGGFLSHLEGKIFLRAGMGVPQAPVRFGIHRAFFEGAVISNSVHLADLPLGHAHAPDWQKFQKHLSFRRSKGSYRNLEQSGFRLAELLDFLDKNEGDAGIESLFREVCEASPALLQRLRERNMLFTYALDRAAALQRWYPDRF